MTKIKERLFAVLFSIFATIVMIALLWVLLHWNYILYNLNHKLSTLFSI